MAADDVERRLGSFRRRYRAAAMLRALARGAFPAAAIVGAAIVARRAGLTELHPGWIGAVAAALLGVHAGWSAWRATPSLLQVALRLDHLLESREVVAAAVDGAAGDHPLVAEARRRATTLLDDARPAQLTPLTRWRGWRAAAAGGVLILLAPFVPLPLGDAGEARADPTPEVIEAGEALAERVDELAEGLARQSEEARETATRLEELAEKMQNAEIASREEALVALDGIEEQLRSTSTDPATADRRDRVRAALTELAEDPFAEELASAIAAADAEAIRDALQRMAEAMPRDRAEATARLDQMRRLADKLKQLAEALEAAGKPEEAAGLREVAQALENFDLERATELMKDLRVAEACKAAGEQLGGELERELAEAVNMARYLLNLDKIPSLEEGAGGEGDGPGGPRPGTTSTNLEDDAYATGDPVLRRRQTDEGTDRQGSFERLYDSHIVEAESWVDMQAQGRLGASGAFTEQSGRGSGSDEGVQTPEHRFSSAAAGARERAAELERVPLGYRNLVQRYFDRGAEPPADPPAAAGDEGSHE